METKDLLRIIELIQKDYAVSDEAKVDAIRILVDRGVMLKAQSLSWTKSINDMETR